METIKKNLKKVRENIKNICHACNREPKDIKLIAVSKKKSINFIQEAVNNRQMDFGENYVQEAMEKIFLLKNNVKIKWHFIGKLQSNKCKLIAKYFHWCHTIDRISIAKKLNTYRPHDFKPLNVLIQINPDNEIVYNFKSNILSNLILEIITLPKLKLRGFMALIKPKSDNEKKKILYKKIFKLFMLYKKKYTFFDTLSLGMSNDLELAIHSGSTLLRIGTDIFGTR